MGTLTINHTGLEPQMSFIKKTGEFNTLFILYHHAYNFNCKIRVSLQTVHRLPSGKYHSITLNTSNNTINSDQVFNNISTSALY